MKKQFEWDVAAGFPKPAPHNDDHVLKKRLTFEEWWLDAQHTVPFEEWPEKAIWEAAQENK